jgi:hypothetical protein
MRKTGVLFLLLISLCFIPSQANATYIFSAPSNFTKVPPNPELRALEGAVIQKDLFTITFHENSSPWDAYVSYGFVGKSHPVRLCRYWQVSDIYSFKLRSHFNDAVIEPREDVLLSFKYQPDMLKVFPFVYFPENSLKIVETDDLGATWTMLKSSVVDEENNTVSALTGFNKSYIVVAGFVNPKILCHYDGDVLGASTIIEETVPKLPVVGAVQYYYQVFIDYLQSKSEH